MADALEELLKTVHSEGVSERLQRHADEYAKKKGAKLNKDDVLIIAERAFNETIKSPASSDLDVDIAEQGLKRINDMKISASLRQMRRRPSR